MIALAAALMALASWLLIAAPPEPRLIRLLQDRRDGPPESARTSRRSATAAAAVLAAVGVWLLVGGPTGALLGLACAVAVPRLTRNLESRATRAAREQLERQAPLVADLIAATVASGSTMRRALAAVGAALGGSVQEALRPILGAVELGADPTTAWRSLPASSALSPIRDAVVRSAESGAPLAGVMARLADDMRRDRHVAVEVAARSAGVRAVAPLAACFLPAFLLVGVVPVVASLAGDFLS